MTGPESDPIRRHVIYRGRVQGVCFRATAHDLSRDCRVVGYVRNMPDGTVELEAEGEPAEVDRFLASVQRHFQHNIRNADVTEASPTGDDQEFRIRY
jgi:acylphosphatase